MPVQPPTDNDRWATIGFYLFMGSLVIGLVALLIAPLLMF